MCLAVSRRAHGVSCERICVAEQPVFSVSEQACKRVIGSECTTFRTLIEWQRAGQTARSSVGYSPRESTRLAEFRRELTRTRL